ncbi:MAG: HEAT repeat domain-containing protein [Spirochaetes bacterium]|nr:HEAT repeat domain-containing protein [Spirochaetota bacterium]
MSSSASASSRGSERRRPSRAAAVAFAAFATLAFSVPFEARAQGDPLAFRYPIAGIASFGPFAAGGRFWTVSADRNLYVVFPDGRVAAKRAWSGAPPSWLSQDPYGRALIDQGVGTLALVDGYGREIRQFTEPGRLSFPPAFGADGRSFLLSEGAVSCRSSNGHRLWTKVLASAPCAAPVVADSAPGITAFVAFGTRAGKVVVLGPDGRTLAEPDFGRKPVFLQVLLNAGDGTLALLVVLSGGEATVIDAASFLGESTAAKASGVGAAFIRLPGQPVAMAASGTYAYGILEDGTVFAIDSGGRVAWTTTTGLANPLALRAFPERVIAMSGRGASSLSPSGEIFRELAIRNATGAPDVDASGILCSPGADWILYAYDFEKRMTGTRRIPALREDLVAAREAADNRFWWVSGPSMAGETARLLDDIEKNLEWGSIGEDEAGYRSFLLSTALAAAMPDAGRQREAGGAVFPDPLPRARACALLGELGSPTVVEALVTVFLNDPDPAVRTAAAGAIASIGLDPSGTALAAFEQAAANSSGPDEAGALAVIGAIEGIYRGTGRTDDPSGIRAIIRFSQRPYPQSVRNRAMAVLDALRKR